MSESVVLKAQDIVHRYGSGDTQVTVLEGLQLQVQAGERLAIMGASGAGKSTLLNILGGLDNPTSGEVWLSGQSLSAMNADQRAALRNTSLGFVYQFHHLMPEFTALENAAMPALIAGKPKVDAYAEAESLLSEVGLLPRLKHKPGQLSGGERQRVAIARALVMKPACVLLDEPTGNLDVTTAQTIQDLLSSLSEKSGIAFVTVTHDPNLAAQMDRCLELAAGQLTPRVF